VQAGGDLLGGGHVRDLLAQLVALLQQHGNARGPASPFRSTLITGDFL
jgi:hypothetical protein